MNKRGSKVLLIVLVMAGCLLAFALTTALAQESKEKNITLDQARRFSLKFERGDKITVDNRTTGRITIIGWDSNFIEATATSERGVEVVNVEVNNDASGRRIFLKADYADLGDGEISVRPSDTRRASLKTRLQSLNIRVESLKARLAAIDAAPNRAELEGRREDIAASLEVAEARRKEVLNLIAELDAQKPAPPLTPKPEAVPRNPMEPVGPNTITPPTITPPTVTWPPLQPPSYTPYSNGHPVEVNLEVKLPRSAEIELVKVFRSNVEVTGIETPLIISGDRSAIKLSEVGAVEVKTRGGNVEIENAAGLVDVMTASGAITVRGAASDVRALSISGDVDIECARGRVDVSTTDGAIKLTGVGGDVDATTTNSQVSFTGAIREDGRYHLKSMSGYVEMTIQANPPGFTVALSSYKGMVSTGFFFLLKLKQASPPDPPGASPVPPPFSRRLTGSYGNGRAQLTLDSFDGVVLLNKGLPSTMKECKIQN
jgi:phage baseplate assembly protein gpV